MYVYWIWQLEVLYDIIKMIFSGVEGTEARLQGIGRKEMQRSPSKK